jgi:GntR family transcriptional repressor for pyruvate dehydrogenase complex
MKKENKYFQPYKSQRSFDGISNEIKKLIFQGVLKPGDRLPSEIEIARQFNVSRQTIRESLRILEHCGFISIQQGVKGGPFVADTILNRMTSIFLDAFNFKHVSIEELTEARCDIEKTMLRHVIDRADESDIKRLRENVQKAKRKLEKKILPFEENITFHKLLAGASKNYIFIIVMESIMAVVSDFRSRLDNVNLERSRRVVKYHENILEAITERNYETGIDLFEGLLKEVSAILKGN